MARVTACPALDPSVFFLELAPIQQKKPLVHSALCYEQHRGPLGPFCPNGRDHPGPFMGLAPKRKDGARGGLGSAPRGGAPTPGPLGPLGPPFLLGLTASFAVKGHLK